MSRLCHIRGNLEGRVQAYSIASIASQIKDITFFPPATISIAVGNMAAALALRTAVISLKGIILW